MKKVLMSTILILGVFLFTACSSTQSNSSMKLSDEELVSGLEQNAAEYEFKITDISYYYDEEEEDKDYGFGGDYWIDMTIKNSKEFSEERFASNLSKLNKNGCSITGENGYDYLVYYENITFKGKIYTVDEDNVVYDEDDNAIYDPTGKETEETETTTEATTQATTQATTEATTSDSSMKKVKDGDLKTHVWICAKDVASQSLKSPGKAKFCPIYEAEVYSLGGNQYMAMGYVDAQNSYGAEIRTNFCVWLTKTKDGYKDGYVEFDE